MANLSCSFASHCDSYCDISSRGNELLPLSSCSRDVSAHLRQISVSYKSVSSEKELILARVGCLMKAAATLQFVQNTGIS